MGGALLTYASVVAAETNGMPGDRPSHPPRLCHLSVSGTGPLKGLTVNVEPGGFVFTVTEKGRLAMPLENMGEAVALPLGRYRAEILGPAGSTTMTFEITADGPTEITLTVPKRAAAEGRSRTLDTVSVVGDEHPDRRSRVSLTAEEARRLPGTGGDPVKALMNFPGVVPQNFASQDLLVRGSDGRDSRFHLDGIRIGYPFHDMGFYSVFHPAVLETVSFFPGAFGARYGNAMGGLIDLEGRTGFDRTRIRGEVDVNLASASAFLTIPLGRRLQLSLSGRRSYYEFYIDLVKNLPFPDLSPVKKALTAFDAIPSFWDGQGRLDWQVNDRHRLSLLVAGAYDRIKVQTDRFPDLAGGTNTFGLSYEDMTQWTATGLAWHWREKHFSHRLSVWRYDFTNLENFMGVSLGSGRTTYTGADLDESWTPTSNLGLAWGLEFLVEQQPFSATSRTNGGAPPGFDFGGVLDGTAPAVDPAVWTTRNYDPSRISFSPYVQGTLAFGPVAVEPGVRTMVLPNGAMAIDPRLSLSLQWSPAITTWVRGGRYSQAPELKFVDPEYGNPALPFSESWQAALGGEWTAPHAILRTEVYYKTLDKLVLDNPTFDGWYPASAVTNPRHVATGTGSSFGLEILLRTRPGIPVQGWIAYTLSRSERSYYPASVFGYQDTGLQVNDGNDWKSLSQSNAPFLSDTTHALTIAGNVDLVPKRFRLGTRIVLATGKPFTEYSVTNWGVTTYGYTPGPYLGARYPFRFTVDLRLEYLFKIASIEGSLYLDTWNVQFPFRDNVVGYVYPATSKLTADLVGKVPPRSPMGDLPIVPLLGLQLKW